MLTTLLTVLLIALVMWIIYFIAGKFITGTALQLVGLILGVAFLILAFRKLGLLENLL